jgi:hypothetical protein
MIPFPLILSSLLALGGLECLMISLSCKHCGERMKITEDEGGRKARCPKCGQVRVIPLEPGSLPGRRGRGSSSNLDQDSSSSNPGATPPPPDRPDEVAPAKARGKRRGRGTLTNAEKSPGQELALGPTEVFPPGGSSKTPEPVVPAPGKPELATRIEASAQAPPEWTAFLAPAQRADEIGRLGQYRILAVLGAGGMGVVFKAEDSLLGRLVALKAMLPALAVSETARQRFLREARAAAGIQHDHVVTIYQVDEEEVGGMGVPFLVMPLLAGQTLEARIRLAGQGLPIPEVVRIARQVAEGLQAVHARGLVHRDIKPANIWLEAPGSRVKILDFGLARATAGEVQLTQLGAIVGSPAFMAPEQASRLPVDSRCDLFSLGCVLYVMCTGELPFPGEDTLATLMALASTTPMPPHERNPQVPAVLGELVMRLLAKKPAGRPGSAGEVVEALRRIEEEMR